MSIESFRAYRTEQRKLRKILKQMKSERNAFRENPFLDAKYFTEAYYLLYTKEIKSMLKKNRKDFILSLFRGNSNGNKEN